MTKKIIGIIICMLLLTNVTLAVGNITKNKKLNLATDEEWIQFQKILASDGENDDWFGFSIDIDGDYAIIGARWDDVNDIVNAGSAYIFKFDGENWVEETKIYASDGEEGDWFGHSVSISGDYAIVSAASDETTDKASGSVYVFKRDNTSWREEQKLVVDPEGGKSTIDFGWSVCIEGEYALIGAMNDDDLGDSSGSTYVYKYDGSRWNQEQKLLAEDGKAWAYFGYCISIDGDNAIIGARSDEYIGAAYIFTLEGETWTQKQKLVSADGVAGDYFGRSVFINGEYAIVGANCDDDNGEDSGSVYIFNYNGSSWMQQAKIKASDGEPEEEFGDAVYINDNYALIGMQFDDENGMYSGSAYIFKRNGVNWLEQEKLIPPDGGFWEQFGNSVFMKDDFVFICALYDDENGQYSGSAYVYKKIVKEADLDCNGKLSWENISAEEVVTGNFIVKNIGDEDSLLNWEIESFPDWGTWAFNPENGTNLQVEDSITVEIEIIAPPEKDMEFNGSIKVINLDNTTDYCEINIFLKTPRARAVSSPLLLRFLERFPLLERLLSLIRVI